MFHVLWFRKKVVALNLHKVSETATTITLGWTVPNPQPNGYRFSRSDQDKFSHSWDGSRSSVRFSKGATSYTVEALYFKEAETYVP